MVKLRYIITACAVMIIAVWVAVHLVPSEENKVKKQFALLAELVSKGSDEKPLAMIEKTQRIRSLFADTCVLKVSINSLSGSYSPEEIAAYATRVRAYFVRLSLRFYDLDIGFPETDTAEVMLTAKLTGSLMDGARVNEIREVACTLTKAGTTWLFSNFEVVEVLTR